MSKAKRSNAEKARRAEESRQVRERVASDTDNGRAYFDAMRQQSGLVGRLARHLIGLGLKADARRLLAAPDGSDLWKLAELAEAEAERLALAGGAA